MSVEDSELERKYQNLERKYKLLRRNHNKLAGVALQLAEALEALIKDGAKPDVNGIFTSCSKMYPGLVKESSAEADGGVRVTDANDSTDAPRDIGTVLEVPETDALEEEDPSNDREEDDNSGKEYFEGFWSRPKIPRTPQA